MSNEKVPLTVGTELGYIRDRLWGWAADTVPPGRRDMGASIETGDWPVIEAFAARSPTFDLDGIIITAPDPDELIERCRAWDRAIGELAGLAGKLPVGRVVLGHDLREPEPQNGQNGHGGVALIPLNVVKGRTTTPKGIPDPTDLGPLTMPGNGREKAKTIRDTAQLQGYTGDPCTTCGSWETVRSGTCILCRSCGATTGCS